MSMQFTNTEPQFGDSDNKLLAKILAELNDADAVPGPQGPAGATGPAGPQGPTGEPGPSETEQMIFLRNDAVTPGIVVSTVGNNFNFFDDVNAHTVFSYSFATQLLLISGAVSMGSTLAVTTGITINGVAVATVDVHSTLTYAANTTVDFAGDVLQTETLTGNVTFASSNLAAGRSKTLRLIASGGARTLAFPAGWVFVGAAAPTSLASGKTAILALTSFGAADADVVAAYSAQP